MTAAAWRKPIDPELAERSAYWRGALAGEKPPVHDIPEPGFYQRRLVRGGPFVPVRIWIDQEIGDDGELTGPPTYRAEVNGRPARIEYQWPWCADEPIAEADYRYMIDRARWAEHHGPNDPAADPGKPVDWLNMPPPDFPKTKGPRK